MTTPALTANSAPTVRARDLRMTFGRTRALDGVSFDLVPGVTGLLGPNGAGKTTLLRILATVSSPDAGSLEVLGLDPRRGGERLALRARLGYMPQEPGFHARFTAFEFVDYVAILKELHQRHARHDEVRRVLELAGLGAVRRRQIKALSGGMRRRVALAQALLGDPDLLVLDEPTAGLDPEQRLRFRELVSRLGEGRTVLLSTHQTEDVIALCHQVLVLHHGKPRFVGTPLELAGLADGHVWQSQERYPGALAAWRTGTGQHRNIGDPPAGAQLLEPTLEDGYLLLLGGNPAEDAAA
jgi:ABC-2 type transport system ATP-binding protein